LLRESVDDPARIVSGPGALMCDLISPNSDLAIQVRRSAKGASREEGMADVLNGAFDPALLVAASRAARPGVEMIMRAKFKQTRVKMNGIAAPLGDNTCEIVI